MALDRDRLSTLCMTAMTAAVTNDPEGATNALDEIGSSGDPFDMYAACCSFASIGTAAMKKLMQADPDRASDDMWILQELKPNAFQDDPPKAFAARFLVAFANDDRETAPALYRTALEAGPIPFTESVCHLLMDCAGLHRTATQHAASA